MNPAVPTPLRENLSNFSGSLSLSCWIILLLPQLFEQWKTKSPDGIAFGLLVAWLAGDFFNLFGSLYGKLRPNVIILALWFCLSDIILLISYLYYSRQARLNALIRPERERLLGESAARDSEEPPQEVPTPFLISTVVPLALVVIIGYANFALSSDSPATKPERVNWIAQGAGYISTVCYCAARVPQLIQNYTRKSTFGVSIGFFVLSTLGNLTYCASIVVYRWDREWMVDYASWFLGAALAILEDFVILGQFWWYGA